jgi:hypothetical protein
MGFEIQKNSFPFEAGKLTKHPTGISPLAPAHTLRPGQKTRSLARHFSRNRPIGRNAPPARQSKYSASLTSHHVAASASQ